MYARIWIGVSVLLLSAFTGGLAVADIGERQTFATPEIGNGWGCEACTVNGWNKGDAAIDAGEYGVGDHALFYYSGGRGFHLFTWEGNESVDYNFLGNLLDAGVVAIRFRARHSGIGEELVLRAYLFDTFDDDDGDSDWAISDESVVIANTGAGITWQTYTISLRVDDLAAGDFLGTPPTVENVLSAVAQLGLRHDPETAGPGVKAWVESAVYFDDIELLFDSDDDGVVDNDDFCPNTAIPEFATTAKKLKSKHWALVDDDFLFDTATKGKKGKKGKKSKKSKKGKGGDSDRSYSIADTAGCSCEQIVEAQGKKTKEHGCSEKDMDKWLKLVTP